MKMVIPFLKESRIYKALTEKHKCYEPHVRTFWSGARYGEKDDVTYFGIKNKDVKKKDIDVPVKIKVADIKRVLDLKDKNDDPIIIPERLCKGFWLRMGYTSFINDKGYIKSKYYRPYKFLVHCVVHALSHRKGAYDDI
ncbi:hypothetical protein Hanom_Chr15g01407071 [Helianthus anomalus]